MSKKIAVILSGCGVFDGSEIHESTLTLLAIDKAGAQYQCFAPDILQHHVLNHITGEEMKETRNVLVESARIARGEIKPLSEYNPVDFDALIFPGGFGAAKNLCNYAFDGAECVVNGEVDNAIIKTHEAKKPIGALCISPALIARVIEGVEVTIGQDDNNASTIENMGGRHKKSTHGEVIIDQDNKVVTTPCYMLDARISQVAEGADNVVKAILAL